MEKKDGIAGRKFKQSSPVRKKSERILKKSAFSKFTNEASNPVLIDIDISSSPSKEHIIPPSFAADTVVPMEGPLHIHSEIRSKKRNDHSTQTDVPIKTPITIQSKTKSKERKEKALQVEAVNDVPINTPITIKSNTKSKERKEKAIQVEAVNDKKKRRTSTVEVLKPLSVSDSDFEDSVPNVKKKQVCLKKTKKLPKLISKKKQPQVKPKTRSQLEVLIADIAQTYENIIISKGILEEKISKSIEMYPLHVDFHQWKLKTKTLFSTESAQSQFDPADLPLASQWWSDSLDDIDRSA
ncbi:hypothetical protein L1887_24237 [Cichorium endivia]|nr:hypothetical protein L1887_24237 [Cichorium endivia]